MISCNSDFMFNFWLNKIMIIFHLKLYPITLLFPAPSLGSNMYNNKKVNIDAAEMPGRPPENYWFG